MLNKEYYRDLIVELAIDNSTLALTDGVPSACDKTSCAKCGFYDMHVSCYEMRKRWANKEYAEPRIHWEDVPVDTPVYVRDGKSIIPRHFASYDAESKLIKVFDCGKTSFTVEEYDTEHYTSEYLSLYVALAREEDTKKYYRR